MRETAAASSATIVTETHAGAVGHPPHWWPLVWDLIEPLVPGLRDLQRCVFDAVLMRQQDRAAIDENAAQVYFFWYTLPVIEAAGLLSSPDRETTLNIAAAQLALGLHLRHLDDLIDEELEQCDRVHQLEISQFYFATAFAKLTAAGLNWGTEQDAVYRQLFAYERETRSGLLHDFPGLWRRASPLCVLPDTYLQRLCSPSPVGEVFRLYISWALLRDDCDDAMKDLNSGQVTPITALMQEEIVGDQADWKRCAAVLQTVRPVLVSAENRILSRLDESKNRVWRTAIAAIRRISEPDQSAVAP